MKKITYSLTFTLVMVISTVIFITSCNKNDTASNTVKTNLKVIDEENAPNITPDIYSKLGFANFVPDLSRNVILDFNK